MSRKAAYWSAFLMLVCWASLVVPASAQHFKQVKGSLTSVSAGRNEVFGIDGKNQVWRYEPSSKSFSKIAKASFNAMAVGGGNLSQLDEVWGVNASQDVYRFNYRTKEFVQVPGVIYQIAVGVGNQDDCHPYEVWGTNSLEEIFRYNYCTNAFDQIAGSLFQVATGNGDVWGLNSGGQIFHFNFGTESFNLVPGKLVQIAVGVNDVCGIDLNGDVFRYDPNAGAFNNIGGVGGIGGIAGDAFEVSAGGDGLWIAGINGNVFRFDSSNGSFMTNLQAISRKLPPDPEPASLESTSSARSSRLFDLNDAKLGGRLKSDSAVVPVVLGQSPHLSPTKLYGEHMPKYVIERDPPGAGKFTSNQLKAILQTSCSVLPKLGSDIQWIESFVTSEKIYCISSTERRTDQGTCGPWRVPVASGF